MTLYLSDFLRMQQQEELIGSMAIGDHDLVHRVSQKDLEPRFVELACEDARAGWEPIPFPAMPASAGCLTPLSVQPYRVYGGPYCLEVYGEGTLRVEQFQIGNENLFGIGALRVESLRTSVGAAPAGLRLFAGPPLEPSKIVRVHVFSSENTTIEATLWALPFEEAARMRRIARASQESVQKILSEYKSDALEALREKGELEVVLQGTTEKVRVLEQELEELRKRTYVPTPEDLRRRQYEERRLHDRLLTSRSLEPREPLDEEGGNGQWSTACDES